MPADHPVTVDSPSGSVTGRLETDEFPQDLVTTMQHASRVIRQRSPIGSQLVRGLGRGCFFIVLGWLSTGSQAKPVQAQEGPRHSKAVSVIRQVEEGIVAIYPRSIQGQVGREFGSGSIIGERYVLTNEHVVNNRNGIVLVKGMPPLEYEVVGQMPEKDLALIRVLTDRPLHAIPLGRSDDLMAGEPALVGGNPGGRGVVFSNGIVSSPSILPDSNALIEASSGEQTRDRFIQVDSAINPGNSGGPLVNAEGLQIGVVSRRTSEDNVGYAIPIDRVRLMFRDLAAPEDRGDFWTGLVLDPLVSQARVVEVAPDSPAGRAGLQVGDWLTAIDGKPLNDRVGWLLALIGRKPGDTLTLTIGLGAQPRTAPLILESRPRLATPLRDGKSPGLRYAIVHGEINRLDDLQRLAPVVEGVTDGLDPTKLNGFRSEKTGVTFTGYLDIPETEVYHLVLNSDDGSRLYLDDKLVVDNDGSHPNLAVRSVRRLSQGLHGLKLEYFQGGWGAALGLRLERDRQGQEPKAISPQFFRDDR